MPFRILRKQITSFHTAALILGAAGFLSRLLGLFRDRLLAAHYGAGGVLDAYYAAFQIPDTIFTIFLLGAASAAVLPTFIQWQERGKDTRELVQTVLTTFSICAAIAVFILIAVTPWIIPFVAPGFSPETLQLTIRLSRILMLSPFFFGISGIISSVLQAHRRFFLYAIPPLVYNLTIIGGILFLAPWLGPTGLVWGVVLGAFLQLAIQLPTFFSLGFAPRFQFNIRHPGLRKIFITSFPRVTALSLGQITQLMLVAFASLLSVGSVSVFKLAANLVYFPVGIFGVSYALAIFPKLSERASRGEGAAFSSEVWFGVRNIFFWSFPAAALFVVLRAHIVRVILGTGLFDWNDTRLVAASLAVLSGIIVFEGINTLLIRAFYALDRTREPFWFSVASAGIVLVSAGSFLFFWNQFPALSAFIGQILRIGDLKDIRVLAIALAFSFGAISNFFFLFFKLRRTTSQVFGTISRESARPIFQMFFSSVCAGFAAYIALIPFPAIISTHTFLGIAMQGLSAGVTGIIVYILALLLLKNEDIGVLGESIREKLFTPRKTPRVFEVERLDGQESGK